MAKENSSLPKNLYYDGFRWILRKNDKEFCCFKCREWFKGGPKAYKPVTRRVKYKFERICTTCATAKHHWYGSYVINRDPGKYY